MLRSAILRALSEEEARLLRLDPRLVGEVRDQVGLAREPRDPEAVIGIGGQELQERGRRIRRVGDRNVELVRGHDVLPRIAILPPELVADHRHFERVLRSRRILHGRDDARRRQKEDQDDEDGRDGPRQLDLVASIDLRRLATVVVLLPLVLPDGVRQQPEHHDEDRRRDDQDEDRQLENRSCRRGGRREDLCRAQGSRPGECAADQGIQRLSSSREAHLAKACRPRSCAENMPRFGPPALGARTRWHRGDPSRLRQALHGIRTACPSRDGDGVASTGSRSGFRFS